MAMRAALLFLTAVALIFLLGFSGGATAPTEASLVEHWVQWRRQQPWVTPAAAFLTHIGSGVVLMGLTLVAAAILFGRSRRTDALFLLGSVIGGRLLIEFIKWISDRDRPNFDEHPVYVASQSFPSGHAGNSMMTFLALALFAAPTSLRKPALIGAVILSLAIGATRPLLGVHWPSDVLAGWVLGATWAWLWWRLRLSRG